MFWHRLALHLGSTVEELQKRMSSAEFTRWIAYSSIEPFGFPMDNYRMGVPAAAIVNAVRATIPIEKGKSRPKPVKPSDFNPEQRKRDPDLTPEQREHIRKKREKRVKK